MTMTLEELEGATVKEALERAGLMPARNGLDDRVWNAVLHGVRLTKECWTPTDPLLLKAREIAADVTANFDHPKHVQEIRDGLRDAGLTVQIALAALRAK